MATARALAQAGRALSRRSGEVRRRRTAAAARAAAAPVSGEDEVKAAAAAAEAATGLESRDLWPRAQDDVQVLREPRGTERFPFDDAFTFGECGRVDAAQVRDIFAPYVTAERRAKLAEVVSERTYGVLPIVEGVTDLGNLLAICRSAEAFGFGAVDVVSEESAKFKRSARTSAGAVKWLEMGRWSSTSDCLSAARARGFQLVATHCDASAVPLSEIDFSKPTAIVFGNEKDGVSREALEMVDHRVIIPMVGLVESFNVSVAAAIIMYHAHCDRVKRLGASGDLTDRERATVEAAFYLRTLRHFNNSAKGRFKRKAVQEAVLDLNTHEEEQLAKMDLHKGDFKAAFPAHRQAKPLSD